MDNELNNTKQSMNKLESNPIPIGFIYVQLPHQSEPNEIWSNVKWQEVTSQYANLFFRVEGDKTKKFNGGTQEESTKT